jgi:O-succinylbenzoate synthase
VQLKVKQVELVHVRIPLHEPFRISTAEVSVKDAIVLRVETSVGVGWGEASPMAGDFYVAETPESSWEALTTSLIPALQRHGAVTCEQVADALEPMSDQAFARAGLESALWHAAAAARGKPLWALLGGRNRPIASGVAVGITDTIDELVDKVDGYVGEGYRRVKIKIKPGWDVEPVAALRERFADVPLMVDANAAYTLDQADVFEALDRYDLMMFEQPLAGDALDDLAALQQRVTTPICLDESAETLEAVQRIISKGSGRIINIKIQRVGGLQRARQMHDLAASANLPCWLGTMPELGIASAQGLHLATLDNFAFPTDVESSARWFVDDLLEPPIVIDAAGMLHIPDGPATGYRVNPDKIAKYAVKRACV